MADWFSARILLAGFILLLAVLLVILVVGNLRQIPSEVVLDIVRPEADLAMQKINYTETRDGHRKWAVQADSAIHDLDRNMASISNVRVTVFGQKKGDFEISADEGTFDLNSRVIRLSGEVVLNNPDGYSVFTEDLMFDGERQLLKSDKPVRVQSRGLEVSAVGFRYDLHLKQFVLTDSVEATFEGALSLP